MQVNIKIMKMKLYSKANRTFLVIYKVQFYKRFPVLANNETAFRNSFCMLYNMTILSVSTNTALT